LFASGPSITIFTVMPTWANGPCGPRPALLSARAWGTMLPRNTIGTILSSLSSRTLRSRTSLQPWLPWKADHAILARCTRRANGSHLAPSPPPASLAGAALETRHTILPIGTWGALPSRQAHGPGGPDLAGLACKAAGAAGAKHADRPHGPVLTRRTLGPNGTSSTLRASLATGARGARLPHFPCNVSIKFLDTGDKGAQPVNLVDEVVDLGVDTVLPVHCIVLGTSELRLIRHILVGRMANVCHRGYQAQCSGHKHSSASTCVS